MKIDVPESLVEIGRALAADLKSNDHYTADPIFTVERKEVVTGIDPEWGCETMWILDGERVEDEESSVLESAFDKTGEEPEGYMRIGYVEYWQPVAYFVTPQAAADFASRRGCDYRTMVDSGYRNHEWKMIRAFLLSLAAEKPHAER